MFDDPSRLNAPILGDSICTWNKLRSALNDRVLTDIDETLIGLKFHIAFNDVLFDESSSDLLFQLF